MEKAFVYEVDEHISKGCRGNILSKGKRRKCNFPGCSNPDNFALVKCKECSIEFCLSHRHASDHNCSVQNERSGPAQRNSAGLKLLEKLRANGKTSEQKAAARDQAKAKIQAKAAQKSSSQSSAHSSSASSGGLLAKVSEWVGVNRSGPSQEQKQPSSNAAQAVDRMRVKLKAVGDAKVPETDKFYLQVQYSMDSGGDKSISMWFNKNWTVGKVIDGICAFTGVINRNNEANSRKLVLLGRRFSEPLPFDIPLSLLEPQLLSGDEVILKYQ